MALTTIMVTGSYPPGAGSSVATGYVSFTPTARIVDAAGHTIIPQVPITVQLQLGKFSLSGVITTDNAGLLPLGWAWQITESINNSPTAIYTIDIPSSYGTTVDLAQLSPVVPAPVLLSFVQIGGDIGGTGPDPIVESIQGTAISTPPGVDTEFLAGDGTWQTPVGTGIQLGGDIGGTDTDPLVVSTHLTNPLPIAQGGTNATTATAALSSLGALPTAGGTMTGDVSMGGHGIHHVENGSASDDGAAFGQIPTSAASIGGLLSANNLDDVANEVTAFNNIKQQATTGGTGVIQLAGDLGNTAIAPEVLSTHLTNPLPLAQGGTGSTTQNFVDLTSTQSVAGTKTFTGEIIVPTPVNEFDAVTLGYVQGLAAGISVKASVAAGTTTALPANTYDNGSAGVGATLTATSAGALTIDGYTPVLNDRLIIKNEAQPINNGIYTVTTLGTVSVPYVLTRSTDMDTPTLVVGAAAFINNGTVNKGAGWTVIGFTLTDVIGTNQINWTQFSSPGLVNVGNGLTQAGNTISLSTPVTVANGGTGASTLSAAGILQSSNNLSDVSSAATAFANIKQGATTGATGVVELAGDLAGTATSPTVVSTHLTNPLPVAQGGTGSTTLGGAGVLLAANNLSDVSSQQTSLDNIAGAVTSGDFLRGNGTNVQMSAIQVSDVPTLNQNTTGTAANVTGTVAVNHGGTGQTTVAAAYNALSPMTTTGDIEYESGANTAARLPGNTSATKNFLTQTGNGSVSAAPAWGTIAVGDVPTLNQNTTGTAANVTGTVAIANGGTGQTTAASAFNALDPMTTTGDLIYESAANTAARLPGNTTTTKQFLTQTGTGSVSTAPGWNTIASTDLPSATSSTLGAIELTGDLGGTATSPTVTGIGTVAVAAGTSAGQAIITTSATAAGWSNLYQGLWQPQDSGYSGWSFLPDEVNTAQTIVKGTIYVARVRIPTAITSSTSVSWYNSSAGFGVTANQNYVGLYSTSTLAQVAVTAALSTQITTAGLVSATWSTATGSLPAGDYFVAMLQNAMTVSKVLGNSSFLTPINGTQTGAALRFGTAGTSRTSLPSTLTTPVVTGAFTLWFAVL